MPYKDKPIEKLYYSIGEVAKHFNVATSLIRFWESEFDFLRPQKNQKGNRRYTKEDMEKISMVYNLVKVQGYTLSGAKEVIKIDRRKAKTKSEAIIALKRIKGFLEDIKDKL